MVMAMRMGREEVGSGKIFSGNLSEIFVSLYVPRIWEERQGVSLGGRKFEFFEGGIPLMSNSLSSKKGRKKKENWNRVSASLHYIFSRPFLLLFLRQSGGGGMTKKKVFVRGGK